MNKAMVIGRLKNSITGHIVGEGFRQYLGNIF
jgi:hypothetical protein